MQLIAIRTVGGPVSVLMFVEAAGELLEEPQSGLLLSSGLGRHWPEARAAVSMLRDRFSKLFCSVSTASLLRSS